MTLALFALPFALLLLVRHRLQPVLQSPVWLVTIILCGLGLAGWALQGLLLGQGGGTIGNDISADLLARTARLIAVSACALAVGVALMVIARVAPPSGAVAWRPMAMPAQAQRWLLPAAIAPLAMIAMSGLVPSLLERPTYFTASTGSSIASFAAQLGVPAVAGLGYIVAVERGWRRLAAVTAAILYLLLFFSLGSRRLTLVPICFALGIYVAHLGRRSRIGVLIAGAFAVALLPVPLFMRGLPLHGLLPYASNLPAFFSSDIPWLATINNVMIFYPITALTAFGTSPIPVGHLLIELNPLPGGLSGWYEINRYMGLNRYTPFSGVGELGNVGTFAVVTVWLTVGVLLAYLDGRVRALLASGRQVAAVGILGLSALFAITVVQYNLRNAQRSLIYALLIAVALQVIQDRKPSAPTSRISGIIKPPGVKI